MVSQHMWDLTLLVYVSVLYARQYARKEVEVDILTILLGHCTPTHAGADGHVCGFGNRDKHERSGFDRK